MNLIIVDNGPQSGTGQGHFCMRVFSLQVIHVQSAGKGIPAKIRKPQKCRKGCPPHTAHKSTLLSVKAVGPHTLMSEKMQSFILIDIVGLLKHGNIVRAALMEIAVFIRIDRVNLNSHHAEIFSRQTAGLSDILHAAFGPALTGEDENFLHTALGNDLHFLFDALHVQLHPADMVIAVKSAVHTVILTVIGNIKRREQIHRIAKMLTGFNPCPLSHLLQKRFRRRGQQCFEIFYRTGFVS